MTLITDVFNNNAFSAVEMTGSIGIVPNFYGRLNELGLFSSEGVTTTSVAVQYENGSLTLLPTRQRGGPPTLGLPVRRNARIFSVWQIPHEDFVLADDVQNLTNFAGSLLENVQTVVNRKLARMRLKHAQTLEHLRMGALKGIILDADGSTLLNLFTTFGVTEKVVAFVLGTPTTNVLQKCRDVISYFEDNLLGETMTGVYALCSPEFYAALIAHATVVDAYKYFSSGNPVNPLRNGFGNIFQFGGITFEEYRGAANGVNEDGTFTTRKFIPANECRFFPVGTTDTFSTYFGPADFMDTVNTLGQEVYARQAPDQEFNRWVKIHTQSNPLPLVKRPALLAKGTVT
jgi:hypothetical protein